MKHSWSALVGAPAHEKRPDLSMRLKWNAYL